MVIDELLLQTGGDIPFRTARVTIHQPRLKEIAYLTQTNFWPSCQLLKFNKESLTDQDRIGLTNMSNFNIIMTIVQGKDLEARQAKINMLSLLTLLFPTSEIILNKKVIQIRNVQTGETNQINQQNYDSFKKILVTMFCLTNKDNEQYNPSGDLARKIANKIKRGREQRAKLAPENKVAILSRYVSILAVGQQKDMNDLMNYTVYQLMDEFNRFNLKLQYDSWQKFKIAGATGMEDPEDWLKDIHE